MRPPGARLQPPGDCTPYKPSLVDCLVRLQRGPGIDVHIVERSMIVFSAKAARLQPSRILRAETRTEKAAYAAFVVSGGGAENRTPVHSESLVRLYKLSQCSGLKIDRRIDVRRNLESVLSFLRPYRLRAEGHFPKMTPHPGREST